MTLVLIVIASTSPSSLSPNSNSTRRDRRADRARRERGRIVSQLFIEALVLSLPPALLGLALGQYAVEIGNQITALDLEVMGGAAPFWLEHGPQPSTMPTCSGSSW